MGEPVAFDGERDPSEEQLLLPEAGSGDQSWRLNFDGFQLSEEHKEKPPRGLHDCLGVLGNFAPNFRRLIIFLKGFF